MELVSLPLQNPFKQQNLDLSLKVTEACWHKDAEARMGLVQNEVHGITNVEVDKGSGS